MVAVANAYIKEEGLWTGHDWTSSTTGYSFENGVPYSNDEAINRRITSQLAWEESEMDGWTASENVMRVDDLLGEDMFNSLFPLKDSFYTY